MDRLFLDKKDIERFYKNISIKNMDECWDWKLRPNEDGYGKFKVKGKTLLAHRVSYFISHKTLGENMLVCHTCDNTICVNPHHLFLGKPKDNSSDMVSKNRQAFGDKNGRSKLSWELVGTIRSLFSSGVSQSKLAKKFHVSDFVIWGIVHNKLWRINDGNN